MNWRVYWSDEATLKLSVNYLFVYVRIWRIYQQWKLWKFPQNEKMHGGEPVMCKGIHGIVQPMVFFIMQVSAIYMAHQLLTAESRLKKKLMRAMCLWSRTYCFGQWFGASIHLKCRQSLEVVYNNLMNWRIYSSDEGTLQQSMNYLFVCVRIWSIYLQWKFRNCRQNEKMHWGELPPSGKGFNNPLLSKQGR